MAPSADLMAEDVIKEEREGSGDPRRAQSPTSAASGAPARRGSVRINSRRISTKSLPAVNNYLAISDNPALTSTNLTEPASPTNPPEQAPQRPAAVVNVASMPPPPPPRPSAPAGPQSNTPSMSVTSTASPPSTGLPPKTPARANLLGAINALRKD